MSSYLKTRFSYTKIFFLLLLKEFLKLSNFIGINHIIHWTEKFTEAGNFLTKTIIIQLNNPKLVKDGNVDFFRGPLEISRDKRDNFY